MLKRSTPLLCFLSFAVLLLPSLAWAQSACPQGNLIIYRAGSLTATFTAAETLFTTQTGVCVTDVAAGSVDAVRRVTAGGQPADILALADYLDIDLFLKPARYADYDIHFGKGAMVLAYTTNSKFSSTIATTGTAFTPPTSVPVAAADWYTQLTQPGVNIAGSHPFLDPSGYHADQIFQLAEKTYGVANLYDTLLQHYSISKSTDVLGQTYDYQFIYESNAQAIATGNSNYRYVQLPEAINLGSTRLNPYYRTASITVPGLDVDGCETLVTIPAARVEWGLTILRSAPNHENAIKFLQFLFGSQGLAIQQADGPPPISPPLVSREDFEHLPHALKSLVSIDYRPER